MSEERAKILKMLKEGRITVEEAELLLDALGEGRESESAGSERFEEAAKSGEPRHEHRRSVPSWLDLDFGFDFSKLKPGLEEAFKGMEVPIRDFVKSFTGMNVDWKLGRFFGKESGHAERQITAAGAGISGLQLTNSWGDVTVRGGAGTEVELSARVSAWGADSRSAQDVAEEVEIEHYREGDTLVVKHRLASAVGHARYKVDLEVAVPRAMRVELHGMSGNLDLSGTSGEARLITFSGDIHIEDVVGNISADSKSGDIELSGCTGDVACATLSGDIALLAHRGRVVSGRAVSGEIRAELTLEDSGSVTLRTVSGDVRLKLPQTAAVKIKAETTSGEIDCALPLAYSENGTRRIEGVMNSTDGHVEIGTKSGSIALRPLG